MPFIHNNYCANPIACLNADVKMRKFWNRNENWEAKYFFASYLKIKKNLNDNYGWW